MPEPIALCIEDLNTAHEDAPRYLMCVATVGDEPGLTLDGAGGVLWRAEGGICELWVSGDDQLMLLRPEQGSTGRVVLHRNGRSLEAPRGKPVVLKHADELEIGQRWLKLHLHGEAPEVIEPTPYVPEPARRGGLVQAAKATATALALTAAVGLAGPAQAQGSSIDEGAIEVRTAPPKIARPRPKPPKKPVKKPTKGDKNDKDSKKKKKKSDKPKKKSKK
jgi:hypothetical protein